MRMRWTALWLRAGLKPCQDEQKWAKGKSKGCSGFAHLISGPLWSKNVKLFNVILPYLPCLTVCCIIGCTGVTGMKIERSINLT